MEAGSKKFIESTQILIEKLEELRKFLLDIGALEVEEYRFKLEDFVSISLLSYLDLEHCNYIDEDEIGIYFQYGDTQFIKYWTFNLPDYPLISIFIDHQDISDYSDEESFLENLTSNYCIFDVQYDRTNLSIIQDLERKMIEVYKRTRLEKLKTEKDR